MTSRNGTPLPVYPMGVMDADDRRAAITDPRDTIAREIGETSQRAILLEQRLAEDTVLQDALQRGYIDVPPCAECGVVLDKSDAMVIRPTAGSHSRVLCLSCLTTQLRTQLEISMRRGLHRMSILA